MAQCLLWRARAFLHGQGLARALAVPYRVNHRLERRVRENRMHGAEGGGPEEMRGSLPLCALTSARCQRGESPLRADALRPVIERNCVVEGSIMKKTHSPKAGWEATGDERPVRTMRNSFRPGVMASLHQSGEAQTRVSEMPVALRGSVSKGRRETSGAWRWNGREGNVREVGRPTRWPESRVGVSAPVRAMKCRNGHGAKGCRKVEA